MHSRHFGLYLFLAAIVAAIVAAILWLAQPETITVVIEKVEKGLVRDTVANTRAGTVKACRRAGISSSAGGQIASLPVREGDLVKAGQVLMELWNEDQQAQYALARSEHRAAIARANQVCVLAEVAKREAQRLEKLQLKNLSSEEAVDRADGQARAQRASCDAAHASAEVSADKLEVIQAALSLTRLIAPFNGIVAEVNGEIGEFVTPSPVGIPTPPAIDLMDISCLYVSAPIDEVDAPRIRVNMPTMISLDAFADQLFEGKVRRIAPYVLEEEKQARTVDVEVDFLCQEDCTAMLPGYSADVEIILDQRKDVLRIPTEAILEGNKVLLVDADRILQSREIETGISNWEWTEITQGLSAGDEIVISVEREGVEAGVEVTPDSKSNQR